jgi:uncharacterized protein YlxW (UPF0749 family)
MKHPISWHKECFSNSSSTLAERRRHMEKLQAEIDRHQQRLDTYALQIERAEREGLEGFDSDRFKP